MVVVWVGISLMILLNSRRVHFLKHLSHESEVSPPVAVIIAVKDEENDVEEALRSVCQLQYPYFRVVVINDRSTDGTAAILDRMSKNNPKLTVFTIDQLPAGWLGKNHALYRGYEATAEEWLLFTDADVKFAPYSLQKAMNYVKEKDLDHLTMMPELTSRDSLFMAVMNVFGLMLEIKLKPWLVSDPKSSASMGVGAFNLVKRSAYVKAGTHQRISLRPDDDLKLGERIKRSGGRQDVLYGDKEVGLEWYTSLGQFVNGLMKNMYSVHNYRLLPALGTALMTFLVFVLPVPLLLLSGSPYYWLCLIVLAFQVALTLGKQGTNGKWWYALLIPFAGLVMIWIIIKSTVKTIRQGGIYWRGTFYPLSELRKQV